ncbi:XRE family transcriptional regulator [bacterium D16-59]|nr:XRE family transcriptional regulator [bacterium D16-59]
MASDKITITDRLRIDIIEKRKSRGISSYELSERTGNGHSKFWLQNIESGKTKKITKENLISLYMAMDGEDADKDNTTLEIERILNQSIGDNYKQWYELIDISDDFAENYDDDNLMDTLDELLENNIIDEIRNAVFGMSVNQKQAALTALQNFYYSLYKNSDLAFALINIPIYGVKELDTEQHNAALNDLLAISAKYNDLVLKNNSLETIKTWFERDKYYAELNKRTIQTAFVNFKNILIEILETSKQVTPNLHELANKFNMDVTFMIERGQPNVTKHYLKSFRIYDGKGFAKHIEECYKWFRVFDNEYEIEDLYTVIPKSLLNSVYAYLNTVGEIKPILE